MMNETVNEMQNEEMILYVFDVEYIDWDGSVEIDRVTAEDEAHAVRKFEMIFEMVHSVATKILDVRCRGEACALRV